MKKVGLSFLIVMGVLIALYFTLSAKVYPVATVNGSFISARSFQTASTAASTYYTKLVGIYGGVASTTQAAFDAEMRRTAMEALIEDQIVLAQLQTTYDPIALDAAVKNRVDTAFDASAEKTVQEVHDLFGITIDEFKEAVLAPQARLEILQKDFDARHADFVAWFGQQLDVADVSIALNDLTWQNGQVELTGQQPYTAKVKELFEQVASTTSGLQAAFDASSTASSSAQ